MKATDFKPLQKSPCSAGTAALPEFLTCPKCGAEVELWSDEELTSCLFCGHRIFKKENIIH